MRIFACEGTACVAEHIIELPSGPSGTGFGRSLAAWEDRLLVGMRSTVQYDNTTTFAYVYRRDNGAWLLESVLVPPEGTGGDLFGWSVAIHGDLAAVGAISSGSHRPYRYAGAVHVFRRTGSQWQWQQELRSPLGLDPDGGGFGWAVALDEGRLFIGDREHVPNGGGGRVFVYGHSGADWTLAQTLTASDATTGDLFGAGLGLDDDLVLVGAPVDENDDSVELSAVFPYHLRPR